MKGYMWVDSSPGKMAADHQQKLSDLENVAVKSHQGAMRKIAREVVKAGGTKADPRVAELKERRDRLVEQASDKLCELTAAEGRKYSLAADLRLLVEACERALKALRHHDL